MERVQKVLGWGLSAFCAYLLILNPFGRAYVGEPLWVVTDWITVSVMILTALTALIRFHGARSVQIFCFVGVGVGALASQSQTVGLTVLNAGFILALFYGWYRTYPLPKVIATGVLFFALVYVFDKATTNNNLVATINWLLLFTGLDVLFWGLYWSVMSDAMLVAKSYKNELEELDRLDRLDRSDRLDEKERGDAP